MRKLGMPANGSKTKKVIENKRTDNNDNFGLGAGLKSLERNEEDIDSSLKTRRTGSMRASQVRYKSPTQTQVVSRPVDKRKEAVSIPIGKKSVKKMNNNVVNERITNKNSASNNTKNLNASAIKKKMQEKANERSGMSSKQHESENRSKEMLNTPKNRLEKHQGNVQSRVTTKIQPKVQPAVHLKMQPKAEVLPPQVEQPKVVIPTRTKQQPSERNKNIKEDSRVIPQVIEKELPSQGEIKKRMQQNAHLHNSHERPVEVVEIPKKIKPNSNNNEAEFRPRGSAKIKPKTTEQPYVPKFNEPRNTRHKHDEDEENYQGNNTHSKPKVFIIIGVILSIILLGGGYWTLTKNKTANNIADQSATSDKDSQALQISSATKFVGIVEGSLVASDYDRASQAVNALKDCGEKIALQERLDTVKKDMDNTSSTSKAESARQAEIAKEVESKEPTKPADSTPAPADSTPSTSTPAPAESKPATTPAPAPKASTPAPKASTPATPTAPAKKPIEQQKTTIMTIDKDGNVLITN